MTRSGNEVNTPSSVTRAVMWICLAVVVVVATGVRVAPLVAGGKRLQYQCVTEDGYLMLTIARNIAMGRGFSVSDGLVASNGTQPLAAVLYAGCYLPANGDRLVGLYYVVGAQILISAVTAVLMYVLTRRLLYRGPCAGVVAAVAACLWYASPSSVVHTQNSLETGLYALLLLLSVCVYDKVLPRLLDRTRLMLCLGLGAVLGLTFLGRNDACFLIAIMLLWYLLKSYHRGHLLRGVGQAFVVGATSVVVAMPWLLFNVTKFGHVIPTSGRAEAAGFVLGRDILRAFAALLEDLAVVIRLPSALEWNRSVQMACACLVLGIVGMVLWKRHWLAARFTTGVGTLGVFLCALFMYYGIFFDATHFLGRYFYPGVMPAALVGAALIGAGLQGITTPRGAAVGVVVAIGITVVMAGLNLRVYAHGESHMHEQVVDWVQENVEPDVWVAAVQTGTLGYYHDRTINLDGKVDPQALVARLKQRTVCYLLKRDVQYVVDWEGLAAWASLPDYGPYYELLVHEPERNLAVLRRRATPLSTDRIDCEVD